jgi:hypothetical protein
VIDAYAVRTAVNGESGMSIFALREPDRLAAVAGSIRNDPRSIRAEIEDANLAAPLIAQEVVRGVTRQLPPHMFHRVWGAMEKSVEIDVSPPQDLRNDDS